MAGPKGAMLSEMFGGGSAHFGLPDWPDFHRTWTAVRTRFIDDQIQKYAESSGCYQQLVNLGAGTSEKEKNSLKTKRYIGQSGGKVVKEHERCGIFDNSW